MDSSSTGNVEASNLTSNELHTSLSNVIQALYPFKEDSALGTVNDPSSAPGEESHARELGQDIPLTEELKHRRDFLIGLDNDGDLWSLQHAILKLRAFPETLEQGKEPQLLLDINDLAQSLTEKCWSTVNEPMIKELLKMQRDAIDLLPENDPRSAPLLMTIGNALTARFDQAGISEDLDESIVFHGKALALRPAPHPDRSDSLGNLSESMRRKYIESSEDKYLDQMISYSRESLSLIDPSHRDYDISLNNLAISLSTRCQELGDLNDLEEAISLHREALSYRPASHPSRPTSLNNLGKALLLRFDQSGDFKDLEEAITLLRESVELYEMSHHDRPASLNNLANALLTRFQQLGTLGDMDEATLIYREALSLTDASHPTRSSYLNNLGSALFLRFQLFGKREDLDEAIIVLRESLYLTPANHSERSMSINSLANVLLTRFDQTSRREDLDETVTLYREGLALCPGRHTGRLIALNNLASALTTLAEYSSSPAFLDEAIAFHRETVESTVATSPQRWTSIFNLGTSLVAKFWAPLVPGKSDALDEAILRLREALSCIPNDHPSRYRVLFNLTRAMLYAYNHYRQEEGRPDIQELLDIALESLGTLPPGHPSLCGFSSQLAEVLMLMYAQDNDSDTLDNGMDAFKVAVESTSSSLSSRLIAARLWAKRAEEKGHSSALEAYEQAIGFLPQLSSLGDKVGNRQGAMAGTDGLARNAALYAIKISRYDKAIEFLEAGRAVFWVKELQLHSPMDNLKDVAPELRETLLNLSSELEKGSHQELRPGTLENEDKISMERDASYFYSLSLEWEKTLEKVRKLEGFEEFMRPSKLPTLQEASKNGPVVVLIASDVDAHALIMTSEDVKHVFLPNINVSVVRALTTRIRSFAPKGRRARRDSASNSALKEPQVDEPLELQEKDYNRYGRPAGRGIVSEERGFARILKSLWDDLVEPVIRCLNLAKTSSPSVLRWCPTGGFSFLPIHAAGIYGANMTSVECVADFIISSYTPTISALLIKKHEPSQKVSPFEMMVAIESSTLPSTVQELQKIQKYVSSESLIPLGIPGSPASIEQVLFRLSTASIAHFACHGKQTNGSPLESALVLQDGELKISRIMQQRMPNASLAFLCACETAMGDENLPDEAMHLGAALLFSGFERVVATMWSIDDRDGPMVADSFYQSLFGDKSSSVNVDTSQAAISIHTAILKLRAQGVSFIRWVPFIYLGS